MPNEKLIPREKGIDHSVNLFREGYMFILNRRRSFNTNIFEIRLLGKKTICMGGKKAAEIFYDTEKFKRKNAAPNRVVQTLFGKNGVQTLDGQAHKLRKEMFMSIMTPHDLENLTDIMRKQWELSAEKWEQVDQITFYEEVKVMLCRTACQWAGVPVQEDEVKKLTKDLGAMFESPAAIGPAHWAGRNARNQVEKWLSETVHKVRDEQITPAEKTALSKFTWHRDLNGELLDPNIVAVELLNILRPIVAISIYISFTALAIHHHPQEQEKLKSGDERYVQMFIQEVRRFYPFFPFLVALVKKEFNWDGYQFEEGTLTLLDLYGTNHDSEIWDNPDTFDPERFVEWEESLFSFIPQGGGDYFMGHRCAGELVTTTIMKVSLDYMLNQIAYGVPNQDLSYSMVNIPSIPSSGIILKNVRRKI